MRNLVLSCLAAIVVAGCSQQQVVAVSEPVTLTGEAIGHYCQMIVLNHPGPKAQVHLAGNRQPLWFTQIRDAMAFERMPEETAEIAAIFVSDMGAAASWDNPGTDNWIDARNAHFVVGSDRRGGMGAPELVPFALRQKADAFTSRHGGTVVGFAEITDEMVLAPVDVDPQSLENGIPGGADQHGGEVHG